MSAFDDAFADRVREVFDAYHEPVDQAALARMRAALGHTVPSAPDRAPVARQHSHARRGLWIALAALIVAGAVWLQTRPVAPDSEPIASAETDRLGESGGTPGTTAQPTDADSAGDVTASGDDTPTAQTEPSASGMVSAGSAGGGERGIGQPRRSSPAPSPGAVSGQDTPRPQTARRPPPSPAAPLPSATTAPARPEVAVTTSPVAGSALAPAPAQSPTEAEGVEIAPLPAIASVVAPSSRPPLPSLGLPREPPPAPRPAESVSPYRVTVSTSAPLAAGSEVVGVGIAGGVTREWPVAGRLSVSGGAAVAYNRYDVGQATLLNSPSLSELGRDPNRSVDVASRTRAETVALEVPFDVAFDVAGTRWTRLGVSVGLTSAVYLAQSFQEEGTRYSGDFQSGGDAGDPVFVVASESYSAQSSESALSRVELARQLNLGVQLSRRRVWSTELYTRLPLGGLTDRDLGLASVGVRLRVPIR